MYCKVFFCLVVGIKVVFCCFIEIGVINNYIVFWCKVCLGMGYDDNFIFIYVFVYIVVGFFLQMQGYVIQVKGIKILISGVLEVEGNVIFKIIVVIFFGDCFGEMGVYSVVGIDQLIGFGCSGLMVNGFLDVRVG